MEWYDMLSVNASTAFFVTGSDVYGPMGNELIPFLTNEAAQNFMTDHRAEKIIRFDDITPKLVMGLDGLEYTE